MANTKSAKKAIRVIERKTKINKIRRSRVRTYLRKLEEVIKTANYKNILKAFNTTQSELIRASQKSVFNKKMVARKISRLSKRIKVFSL